MTAFELTAVIVTLLAVYLTTRQNIWCWPTALLSVSMYAVVFFEAKLYADMGLQAIYFALAVYGWWAWLHGGENRGRLEVSRGSRTLMLVLAAIGAVSGVVLGLTLHRFTDASIPFMDSTLSSFSIVAQWMQTRKLLETWLLWIVVDVFYVGMFVYKGLGLTAGLYAIFLVLAVKGYLNWKRSIVDR